MKIQKIVVGSGLNETQIAQLVALIQERDLIEQGERLPGQGDHPCEPFLRGLTTGARRALTLYNHTLASPSIYARFEAEFGETGSAFFAGQILEKLRDMGIETIGVVWADGSGGPGRLLTTVLAVVKGEAKKEDLPVQW